MRVALRGPEGLLFHVSAEYVAFREFRTSLDSDALLAGQHKSYLSPQRIL
jgi:hypothetical protein